VSATAPLEVEYVPAEHAVQGWGAGGCAGSRISASPVSGPLYVTTQLENPLFSKNSTKNLWTPVFKTTSEQILRAACNPPLLMIRLLFRYRNDPSSEVVQSTYVPACWTFKSIQPRITNLSVGVPDITALKAASLLKFTNCSYACPTRVNELSAGIPDNCTAEL
jgi:hypothetical protein